MVREDPDGAVAVRASHDGYARAAVLDAQGRVFAGSEPVVLEIGLSLLYMFGVVRALIAMRKHPALPRPMMSGDTAVPFEGGRVTELVARPPGGARQSCRHAAERIVTMRILISLLSLLVPRSDRPRWREEWRAELRLQAGSGYWVDVRIWPNVKAGDKIELYADIGDKVAESNEANNAASFNW